MAARKTKRCLTMKYYWFVNKVQHPQFKFLHLLTTINICKNKKAYLRSFALVILQPEKLSPAHSEWNNYITI